jgi:hypothetical protein
VQNEVVARVVERVCAMKRRWAEVACVGPLRRVEKERAVRTRCDTLGLADVAVVVVDFVVAVEIVHQGKESVVSAVVVAVVDKPAFDIACCCIVRMALGIATDWLQIVGLGIVQTAARTVESLCVGPACVVCIVLVGATEVAEKLAAH